MQVAKLILIVMNTVLFCLGAVIAGLAGYVIQFEVNVSDVVPSYAIWAALVAGVILIFISVVACIGAAQYHKKWAKLLLLLYAFLLFLVIALEAGAAAMLWLSKSQFDGCQKFEYGSDECSDDTHTMRNFANTTRSTCCDKRTDPGCSWVESILSDRNCEVDALWKAKFWEHLKSLVEPVLIFMIVLGCVELITLFATCWLVASDKPVKVHHTADGGINRAERKAANSVLDRLPTETSSSGLPMKSRAVLLIVNFILLLLGGAMTGFAAYIWQVADNFSEVLPASAPLIGIITGVSIMMLALLGCVGACYWHTTWAKVLLFIYDLALLIIILVEIIAVILMFQSLSSIEACKNSPLGSAECEDTAHATRDWVNSTRLTCCANRADPACSWASSVLTDAPCSDFDSFKRALLDMVQSRVLPIAVVTLIVALIQLITFCSTCCLIKAKGAALISGKAHHYYREPATSFYYGYDYTGAAQQREEVYAATGGDQEMVDATQWASATDDQGRTYYYHKVTKQTQWDPPPGYGGV